MIAYNKQSLDNLYMRNELSKEYYKNCINIDEYNACTEKYPVKLYTPNSLIRIGLFILTVIIAVFSFGLISLMFLSSKLETYTGLLIFFAVVSYAALEIVIRTIHHYKSGVDDALIWITLIFIITACNHNHSLSNLQNATLVFIISFFFRTAFFKCDNEHYCMRCFSCNYIFRLYTFWRNGKSNCAIFNDDSCRYYFFFFIKK